MKYLNKVWRFLHSNHAKHTAVLILLIASLCLLTWINVEVFRSIMMFAGGWQIGGWVDGWCRAVWPLTKKED